MTETTPNAPTAAAYHLCACGSNVLTAEETCLACAPTAAGREGAASPRCVFCGKRKELREMDGVWLCPGPHEAIALDQLAALRNARDYWQGEANAATAALLAARADADALRAALQDIGEATVTHDPESFRNRVIAILAALAATPEEK